MIGNDELPTEGPDAGAVEPLPFREGSVWSVQFAHTKPGMTAEYLSNLRESWVPVMDQAKREDVILDYRILVSPHAGRDDWDVMLMVEVRDMAALDGYQGRLAGVASRAQQPAIKRPCAQFRDMLGMKLARQITLT
jgi:hypothetical protein